MRLRLVLAVVLLAVGYIWFTLWNGQWYSNSLGFILFFPGLGEYQAARSRSFSASSRNLCGSGGPARTASIS